MLTATSLSCGKEKIQPPQNQNPARLARLDGTVDYVGEGTRNAKFYANPFKGGASRQMGEIHAKIFIAVHTGIPFFQKLTYRSDPAADFRVRWLKRRGLAQECAFWRLKN